MDIKKIFPKKILLFRQKILNYLSILDEMIFYYNFNYKKMKQDNNKFLTQLTKTKFITSRGFLNISNIKNEYQEANDYTVDINGYTPENLVIYICSDGLENFIKKTLQKISKPFILITGNSDRTITKNIKSIKILINNKFLIKWYAQNLNLNNKKLIHLPIGLDYHAGFKFRNKYKSIKEFPSYKEKYLIKLSKKKIKKEFKMYANWLFNMNKKREKCLNQIQKNLVYFEEDKVSQIKSWENITKYRFCLCPEGYGLDTHRVWETIILGSIPVVKSGPLDVMYSKFPVIIVKNWKDVTKKLLLNEYKKIKGKRYDYSYLHLDFWKKQFNTKKINFFFK